MIIRGSGSQALRSRPEPSLAASRRAFRRAIASIVIIGLTPDAVGKVEPSATTRLRTSQVWPAGSAARSQARRPIRAEPMSGTVEEPGGAEAVGPGREAAPPNAACARAR